ncbi:hypothetical protein [Prescottella agglutinans]|uniref:Uncharacterized protein n=1 Tax=Prescottella agglutinans TaxID=1644129 RepID=A0ABT6MHI5_9NOCA|nr:hypothetical protein [Prescottella agglutinans]MDH6282819.1 hypothetical protein [Prescottella agglutinans]
MSRHPSSRSQPAYRCAEDALNDLHLLHAMMRAERDYTGSVPDAYWHGFDYLLDHYLAQRTTTSR